MNEAPKNLNPFVNEQTSIQTQATATSDQERAIQEIQASFVIAQKFPRNQIQCVERILQACTRQGVAESALYSYKKGGQEVSGSSIHLAKVIAQNWRNVNFGVRELSRGNGESTVEAFAIDLETNVKETKVFQLPHVRHTKSGDYPITDPREIYELIANYGARRMRNCILDIIPGDVEEAARMQCTETLNAHADTSPDAIKKMLGKFEQLKVTKDMIEDYIGCRVDAIRPAQVIKLRNIYNSVQDGYSQAGDWFKGAIDTVEKSSINEKLKNAQQSQQAQRTKVEA